MNEVTGEPCARKPARTVRRGEVGTGIKDRTIVCYKVETSHYDLARDPLYGKDNTHVTTERQSLTTIRSLGRRGLQVAALETCADVPAFSSRWCQQAFVCTTDEGAEEYFTYLQGVLDCTRARVLITSSEGTISVIRRHREQLEQRVHIALAREPALGIALNKERTLKVAQELGLGVPRGLAVCSVSEVPAALREIGLPAVVKPVESWSRGEKQGIRVACQLVTTPDEAYCAVEELTRFGGSILFQQFLFGNGEDQVCPLQPGQYWISSFLSSLQWDIPISMRRTLFRPGRQLWGLLVICSGK